MFEPMEEPVCLIGTDSDGRLCVMKEAKDILTAIVQPVVVVSVVGLYRTGKSYLMNRLAGRQTGFALGNTIESKTKGIWMWCVPHPEKDKHTLVLLDTEGLGDVNKGDDKHDTWIFCLAVLLSSTLVYNSLGTIDNTALEKLHYVTELTENIRVKARRGSDEDDSAEFMRIFPSFIWAVRDFTLKLEKDGKPITADGYLESALVLIPGSSKKAEDYNLPRRCLRNFFAQRRCFVFIRPAKDEKDLQRMEELTEGELQPDFLEQAQDFCSYVFSSAKTKTVAGGRTLSGTVLGSLVEVYVEAIRSGRIPCLENAVETLAKVQNGRAVEQALQVYINQIYQLLCLPLETSELSDIHNQAVEKAMDAFTNTSFNDTEQKARLELMEQIQNEYQMICLQNQEEWVSACQKELRRVFAPLEEDLEDGEFMHPGGYQEYRDKLEILKNEYRARVNRQCMSEEVLDKYLKEREPYGRNILFADQRLTEAERENEEQCLRTEALKQKQRALEEQNQLQEQALQDQQKYYEDNLTQLLNRTKQEMDRAKEDNNRVLEAKLNEQKALMEKGFKEDANRMNREIENLRGEMKKNDQSQRSTFSKVVEMAGMATMFLPGVATTVVGAGLTLLSHFIK